MFSCKFSVYLQNTFFWEYLWGAAYISIKLEQYKTIEPIYVLDNSLSCIDLLFTSQTDLIVKSRVHYNLHWNCHHQILFAKNNQQIFYPRLYFWEVWYYKVTNIDLVMGSVTDFNRERAFTSININQKVAIFSKTIFNILSNFILYDSKCFTWIPYIIKEKAKNLY